MADVDVIKIVTVPAGKRTVIFAKRRDEPAHANPRQSRLL
jgi:hypothetical protein